MEEKFQYKGCVFTSSWDDAHKLDLKLVKVLQRYDAKGTFYIPIRLFSESLSEDEIVDISRSFEIGSHSLTHAILTKIPVEKVEEEIARPKKILEKITGTEVQGFCYPQGRYNERIVKAVQRAGYVYARTVETFRIGTSAPFRMGTTIQVYPFNWKWWVRNMLNSSNVCGGHSTLLRLLGLKIHPIEVELNSWKSLAKMLFDHVYGNRGIFHLWGHSWEIEKFGMWKELEEVLDYISRKKPQYLTNSEVVSHAQQEILRGTCWPVSR